MIPITVPYNSNFLRFFPLRSSSGEKSKKFDFLRKPCTSKSFSYFFPIRFALSTICPLVARFELTSGPEVLKNGRVAIPYHGFSFQ